jgi:hypothetical protein
MKEKFQDGGITKQQLAELTMMNKSDSDALYTIDDLFRIVDRNDSGLSMYYFYSVISFLFNIKAKWTSTNMFWQ